MFSRRCDTVTLIGKMHHIEVKFQNLCFIKFAFKVTRPKNFLYLALPRRCVLSREVFDQLLRDGRTAKMAVTAQHIIPYRCQRAAPIGSAMFKKSLVFDGNNSIDHRLWNVFVRNIYGLPPRPNLVCNTLSLSCAIGTVGKVINIELRRAYLCAKHGEKFIRRR